MIFFFISKVFYLLIFFSLSNHTLPWSCACHPLHLTTPFSLSTVICISYHYHLCLYLNILSISSVSLCPSPSPLSTDTSRICPSISQAVYPYGHLWSCLRALSTCVTILNFLSSLFLIPSIFLHVILVSCSSSSNAKPLILFFYLLVVGLP